MRAIINESVYIVNKIFEKIKNNLQKNLDFIKEIVYNIDTARETELNKTGQEVRKWRTI